MSQSIKPKLTVIQGRAARPLEVIVGTPLTPPPGWRNTASVEKVLGFERPTVDIVRPSKEKLFDLSWFTEL